MATLKCLAPHTLDMHAAVHGPKARALCLSEPWDTGAFPSSPTYKPKSSIRAQWGSGRRKHVAQ